jgi:hypothetical protein
MDDIRNLQVDKLAPGIVTDILVAEHVLGWKPWTPGVYGASYVVNERTRMLERALDVTAAIPGVQHDYPESDGEYSFSTREQDAALVYKMLPYHLQQWRLTPLEICQRALQLQVEQARENV